MENIRRNENYNMEEIFQERKVTFDMDKTSFGYSHRKN